MRNLFCFANGQKHCLATKREVDGLCIKVNDKVYSVISTPDGNGKTTFKMNGVIQHAVYRVPGMFYYSGNRGATWDRVSMLYIENGIPHIIDLEDRSLNIRNTYFDDYTGVFYCAISYVNSTDNYFRYSFDGINFFTRYFGREIADTLISLMETWLQSRSWWDPSLEELIADGSGGFNLIFSMKGDASYGTRYFLYVHSFHIDNINSELVATNDYVYWEAHTEHYPEYIPHYSEPTPKTINGFTEIKDGDNYKFRKIVEGVTTEYTLSTNKIIWDPVSQYYFMLKQGPVYKDGAYDMADLNLYKSESLEESTFIFVQKVKTCYNWPEPYQSVIRQAEYV